MHKALSRRHLLRGTLGGMAVVVGLPFLDQMRVRRATAAAPPIKRLGIFFWGNGRGVEAERWNPTVTGSAWELTPQLAPLSDVRDYVSVLTGFNVKLNNSSRQHHRGTVALLSGDEYVEQDPGNANYRTTFQSPSIDQVAAGIVGVGTAYRSLELGVSQRVVRAEGTTLESLSHNGPDNINPPEYNPAAVYDRLFAGMTEGTGTDTSLDETRRALRRSVLDGVLEDIQSLRARVGTSDRARLDQHFQNIQEIENRLDGSVTAPVSCSSVADPGVDIGGGGRGSAEPFAEVMAAQSQLVATALACDMTRVFSVMFSGSVGYTLFSEHGATLGHHDHTHEGAAAQDIVDASTIFTIEQFAVLLRTLANTPDGDGNLLDNSAILCTTDCADGAAHTSTDMPILVAGRAGGALAHPGLHIAGDGDNTSKVLLTLLRAVGTGLTEVGGGGGLATETVSDLEA